MAALQPWHGLSTLTPPEIRARRLGLELTQADAASMVGVSRREWIYWEMGERAMPRSAWLVLCALGEVRGFRSWVERQALPGA